MLVPLWPSLFLCLLTSTLLLLSMIDGGGMKNQRSGEEDSQQKHVREKQARPKQG